MRNPDADLPLNCPTCGAPLAYVRTEGETLIYRCAIHGLTIVPPDGRVRHVPDER